MAVRGRAALVLCFCFALLVAFPASALAFAREENPSTGAKGVKANLAPASLDGFLYARTGDVKLVNMYDINRNFYWKMMTVGNSSYSWWLRVDIRFTGGGGNLYRDYVVADSYLYWNYAQNLKIASIPSSTQYYRVYLNDAFVDGDFYWYSNSGTQAGSEVTYVGQFNDIYVFDYLRRWIKQTEYAFPGCYIVNNDPTVLTSWISRFWAWKAVPTI